MSIFVDKIKKNKYMYFGGKYTKWMYDIVYKTELWEDGRFIVAI